MIDGTPADDNTLDKAALIDLLEWQMMAGADLAIQEQPVDHFELQRTAAATQLSQAQSPQAAPSAKAPQPVQTSRAAEPGVDLEHAQELAQSAHTLEDLRETMERFEKSALKMRATQLVFSDGNPDAGIMIVGDAPGRSEDREGTPFAGRAGNLLNNMLAAIDLDRTSSYLTNTIGWRPPGGRAATPTETAACLPFFYRHIELVSPKFILVLGAVATQNLIGKSVSISKARGHWIDHKIGSLDVKILPTHHPDFLLRQPAQKKAAWHDLQLFSSAVSAL